MNDLILTLSAPQTHELILSAPVADGTRAMIICDTTAGWQNKTSYVPTSNTIIVYTDRSIINGVNYPGVKLGDGTTYVVDLPFLGDDQASIIISMINAHVQDNDIHVTASEKEFWNNKLNCAINPLDNETLVFNRQ